MQANYKTKHSFSVFFITLTSFFILICCWLINFTTQFLHSYTLFCCWLWLTPKNEIGEVNSKVVKILRSDSLTLACMFRFYKRYMALHARIKASSYPYPDSNKHPDIHSPQILYPYSLNKVQRNNRYAR